MVFCSVNNFLIKLFKDKKRYPGDIWRTNKSQRDKEQGREKQENKMSLLDKHSGFLLCKWCWLRVWLAARGSPGGLRVITMAEFPISPCFLPKETDGLTSSSGPFTSEQKCFYRQRLTSIYVTVQNVSHTGQIIQNNIQFMHLSDSAFKK